jgi:serine protease Do
MTFLNNLRKQKVLSITLLLFTLSVGVVIGTLVNGSASAQRSEGGAKDAAELTIPNPTSLSTAFTQLAKQMDPSVVFIKSSYAPREEQTRRTPQPRRRQQMPEDEEGGQGEQGMDLFRRFFGQEPFEGMPQMPFRRSSSGSGFVVDKAGYVVTNFHVVEGASRIQVKFNNDPTEYNAKLIGSDPETDVAVLKVDTGKALTPAKMGNSDGVQVGDWCVAIGSPFGLEASVTAGIISAKGREIQGVEHQLQRFIQTDAAINPGNSGGPLLDIQGRVIGINTAIATESGGYQGIGFALPINLAANVYNQIVKTGRVSRGSIGIQFQSDANSTVLKALGIDHGVVVSSVQQGGPSAKAGIQEGDVIVSLNGQPVKDGDDLVGRVSNTPVGSDATVTIVRDGKKQDLKVRIAERADVWRDLPNFRRFRQDDQTEGDSTTTAKFGIDIRNLTQADRDRLQLKQDGVLVLNVTPGSFADDVGLLQRDIIVGINGRKVATVDDVQKIQAGLKPGDAVAFRVMRAGPSTQGTREWRSFFAAGTLTNGQ